MGCAGCSDGDAGWPLPDETNPSAIAAVRYKGRLIRPPPDVFECAPVPSWPGATIHPMHRSMSDARRGLETANHSEGLGGCEASDGRVDWTRGRQMRQSRTNSNSFF